MKQLKREGERHSKIVSSLKHKKDEEFLHQDTRTKRIRKLRSNNLSPQDSSYHSLLENNHQNEEEFNKNKSTNISSQEGALPPQSHHDTDTESSEIIHLDSPPKDFNFSLMMDSGNPANDDELHFDEQIEEQFRLAVSNLDRLNSNNFHDLITQPVTAATTNSDRHINGKQINDNENLLMSSEFEITNNPQCNNSPYFNAPYFQNIQPSKLFKPFQGFLEHFNFHQTHSIIKNHDTQQSPKSSTNMIPQIDLNKSRGFCEVESLMPFQFSRQTSKEPSEIGSSELPKTHEKSLGRILSSCDLQFNDNGRNSTLPVKSPRSISPLNSDQSKFLDKII